jgi:hypothetical protein
MAKKTGYWSAAIASLNNRVFNAKCIIQWEGGLGNCDVAILTHLLNNTPMKPIRYSSGLEQMKRLVGQRQFVEHLAITVA